MMSFIYVLLTTWLLAEATTTHLIDVNKRITPQWAEAKGQPTAAEIAADAPIDGPRSAHHKGESEN